MNIKPALEKANDEYLALTFDDVLIVPKHSDVVPRDANLETKLTNNIPLHIPLLSADMDTVTEYKLARELAKRGGIGFLWKAPVDKQVEWLDKVKYTLNAMIDTPITIHPDQTLEDVEEIRAKHENRFSSLIVVEDDNKVVGLVSRDKTRYAKSGYLVRRFMVENPHTSEREFTTKEAYDYMGERELGKLILVDSKGRLKGLFCYNDVKSIIEEINPTYNRDERGQLRVGANVGVQTEENSEEFQDRVERLLKRRCDVLLVGTAHGHSKNVIETVKEIKNNFAKYNSEVVAGNIATYEGARDLFMVGADAVKVGVGPGSICTTRIVTGCGMPQITAIYEAAKAGSEFEKPVIADGGIRDSGDIVKTIAAGASSVMIGSLFASAEEAPGSEIVYGGQRYKVYRGMGSIGAMRDLGTADRYGHIKKGVEKSVPEGIEGRVPIKGSLRKIVNELIGGLKSGMGYVGARNISELQEKAELVRVTNAGVRESHPHDVEMIKETPNYGG